MELSSEQKKYNLPVAMGERTAHFTLTFEPSWTTIPEDLMCFIEMWCYMDWQKTDAIKYSDKYKFFNYTSAGKPCWAIEELK